jgi:hypothetical protein
MKPEFSLQIFEKYSYQISWKSFQWEQSCFYVDGRTDGQKDRHGEANSRFSQLAIVSQSLKMAIVDRPKHVA